MITVHSGDTYRMSLFRETPFSIRLLFGIGVLSYFFLAFIVADAFVTTVGTPDALPQYVLINAGLYVVWGCIYLYFTLMLTQFLTPSRLKYLKAFIAVPVVVSAIWTVALLVFGKVFDITGLVSSAAFTWYLWRNVTRLMKERITTAQTQVPPQS